MGGGMGGQMGGGMGGGMDMGGGMGGGMPAAASGGGKILKKGKGGKADEEVQQPMAFIKLTGIEQRMAGMLEECSHLNQMNPGLVRIQFPVDNPTGAKRYQLDFAIPHLKLGVECDGELFHSGEQEADDKQRDYLLAQRGWTILRFDDKTIDEAPQAVKQTINTYIQKASEANKGKKSASADKHNAIHLFGCRNGELIDWGLDYEKYFSGMVMHKSSSVGSRSTSGVNYDNTSSQTGVFKQ